VTEHRTPAAHEMQLRCSSDSSRSCVALIDACLPSCCQHSIVKNCKQVTVKVRRYDIAAGEVAMEYFAYPDAGGLVDVPAAAALPSVPTHGHCASNVCE
jgi:hypothetical protein